MSWGVATQNGVSVSLASIVSLSAGVTEFSPADLFLGGVQGAWYDPSDLTTLFQNSAGTTPVTAVEQPVGRMLDKSGNANHLSQATAASRPVLKALYNILTGTATLATQSVTTRAASYTLSFSGAGTITLSGTGTGTFSAGTNTVTCTAGALTVTVSGTVTNADLRLSVDATGKMPAYQDVVTSTNYTTTGFLPYLSFDGTDDSMATSNVNFSATDKMSVFAGVSKLSDAVAGSIVELTIGPTSFDGGFGVLGPQSTANNYGFVTRGITAYGLRNAVTFIAPITNVIAASFDNAAVPTTNQIIARINTISQTLQSGPATSPGNYANAAMYIGRRGGASLSFNGRIYSVIVAGKQSTAAEISNTETWVNGKTGAY